MIKKLNKIVITSTLVNVNVLHHALLILFITPYHKYTHLRPYDFQDVENMD